MSVLAVLLTVALIGGAPAAGAQEVPPADAAIGDLLQVLDDGEPCTGVPDALPGIFDFTSACQEHDVCYAAGVNRLACDVELRSDLVALCVSQHPDAFDPRRYVCLGFAELYFLGVRLFGGFFF